MKRYEIEQTPLRMYVGTDCDGCGETDLAYPIEVIISVHEGEEGGNLDIYDYCDACLTAWAPLLKAAGSRAPIVTGEDLPPEQDDA